MNISVQKLLAKIEDELAQAKNSQKPESLREKVYSIKILCELILDEKQAGPQVSAPAYQPVINQTAVTQPALQQPVFQQPVSLNQAKKIDMDDGANGDSLFDF